MHGANEYESVAVYPNCSLLFEESARFDPWIHLSSNGHCFVGTNNRFRGSFDADGSDNYPPERVKFTTDTKTVIIVLQSNQFIEDIEY